MEWDVDIIEGMFLVSEIHDEVEHLIALISESQTTSCIYCVIISRIEMLGFRAVFRRTYRQWIKMIFYLGLIFINKMRVLIRFPASTYFLDTVIRIHRAPIDSEDFRSELLLCVSAIRSCSKEIALSKVITVPQLEKEE